MNDLYPNESNGALSIFGADVSINRPSTREIDAKAYIIARRAAPSMTEAERQYTLTVARGEGFYGLGWKEGMGKGSHNWGAVQGQGPAGSFQHLDHTAAGKPYTTAFRAYHTDEQGFLDMARILLKPNLREVLNKRGSLKEAVYTQKANRYFELNTEKYLASVIRNYNSLVANGIFKPVLSVTGKGVSVLSVAVTTFLVSAGVRYGYRKYKALKGK